MKKLFVFLLLLSSVSLLNTSCRKDDEAKPADKLVGTWLEVSYVSSGCTDPNDNESGNCTNCETLVATATTLTFEGEPPYSYTADGNTLSVTVGTQVYKVTIEVTDDTLVFTIQDSVSDGNCKSVTTYKRK